MNTNVFSSSRSETFWIIWKPYFYAIALTGLFAWILSLFLHTALNLTPEENFYRRLVLWVDVLIIFSIAALIHASLLKKTNLFFLSQAEGRAPVWTPELLENIGAEIINYPAKFSFYAFVVAIYGTQLLTALTVTVPFIIHSVSAFYYLYFSFTAVSIFLWPLAILQFFMHENLMKSLAERLSGFLEFKTNPATASVIKISFRMKLFTVLVIILASLSVLITNTVYRHVENGNLSSAREEIFWILFGTTVYTLITAWLFSHSLLQPVEKMRAYLSGKTERNFLPITTDEMSALHALFVGFSGRIEKLSGQLREWGAVVSHESEEILNVSKYQSVASSNQASAISQITTTVEELVHSVNQISEDILRVNKAVQEGFTHVEKGKDFIDKTLTSIQQIHQEATLSSQRAMDLSLRMSQIEEVVKIINYITDHTKILAFNAAIETAAAGELGERFGVVAKEIRQLAQNISNSTEEIKKIIGDVRKATHLSVLATEKELKLVLHGKQSAAEAQDTFNHIYEMVKQTFESIEHITRAIEQQKSAHEQVLTSVKEIDTNAKEQLAQNQNFIEPSENLSKISDAIRQASN